MFTIGFSPRRTGGHVSTTQKPTAQAALTAVNALEMSDEVIRFIKAPEGYEIGKGELQLMAEREGQK